MSPLLFIILLLGYDSLNPFQIYICLKLSTNLWYYFWKRYVVYVVCGVTLLSVSVSQPGSAVLSRPPCTKFTFRCPIHVYSRSGIRSTCTVNVTMLYPVGGLRYQHYNAFILFTLQRLHTLEKLVQVVANDLYY